MDDFGRVEEIFKRIAPDLGAKYIRSVDLWPRQDATDFILERPNGTHARVHVDGSDCMQHYEDRMLEDFVRSKAQVAIKSPTQ